MALTTTPLPPSTTRALRGDKFAEQAAIPLGAHAAETVLHSIGGTVPKPVRPKFTWQCISLGRRAALWQQAKPSDGPVPVIMTGRAAAVVKEQICASTVRIGLNPRFTPTYSWSW